MSPVLALLLVLGGLTIAVGLAFWLQRRRIVDALRTSTSLKAILVGAEPAFAVLIAAVAGVTKLFDVATWQDQPASQIPSAAVWWTLALLYIGVKIASWRATDRDKAEIQNLKETLHESTRRETKLQWEANRFVRLTMMIRAILEKKMRRILPLAERPAVGAEEFVAAMRPSDQVPIIVASIHEYFSDLLPPGATLRLGLYLRDPHDRTRLAPSLCYDGTEETSAPGKVIFSPPSLSEMRIDHPAGARSEVVRLMVSPHRIRIVEDCRAAAQHGEFEFLHARQADYLRSLVVFKYVVQRGSNDVAIFSLDCDQPAFFKEADVDIIKRVFDEFTHRLEFELLNLDIVTKFPV